MVTISGNVSFFETTFFHDLSRSRVVHKEVAPKRLKSFCIETVVDHGLERLRAESLVPVGFGNPVAEFGVIEADGNVAFSVGVIAHAANGFSGFLELQGPGVAVGEIVTDNLLAFLDALMGWPAGPRTYVGVRGVFVQRFGVGVGPEAEAEPFGFH